MTTQTHPDGFERTFALARAIDAQARTVELAFSSEEPYARWWGIEILDHSPGSCNLERLNDGRHPLLLNHNTEDQAGVIDRALIGTDRVGRAVARFGRGDLAEEVFQDVQDGIRTLVSVGYMIDEMEVEEKDADGNIVKRRISFAEFKQQLKSVHGEDCFERAMKIERAGDSEPVFRVMGWTPFEISIVGIPADATVGIGRAAESAPIITSPPQQETKIMTEIVLEKDNAAEEKARVAAIRATAQAYAKYGATELALEYIGEGKTVQDFQNAIMAKMATSHTADTGAANIGLTKKETQRYSVLRAIRALTDKDWGAAGFERECHKEILKRAGLDEAANNGFYVPVEVQKRDLTVATAANGGYLVATDNLGGSFIDILRNRSLVAQLGATMLPGLQGNVTIPKQTGANTAYWLSTEETAITEGNLTVGQLALTPKNVGSYQEISRQLMLQSSPAADALVMNDLAKVLAIAIDLAAFEGSGASGQPTGISNTGSIGGVTGTSIAYAGILEFQTDVAGSNALAANCAYVTTPSVAALLAQRQRFTSTDTPLWEGNILDGKVSGFRAASTLQLTAASMIFGDYSQVVIGEWGMLEIALNPYANFTAAISGIRAIQTVDVGVRYAGAFSRATSIT